MSAANDEQQQVFTVTELARRWRCTRESIMVHVRSGAIQTFKLGQRTHRVRIEEVLRVERDGLIGKTAVA